MPHYGDRLELIYNLKSVQEVDANRLEVFLQDTWRKELEAGILSVNYGARLSRWSWNDETLFSPRASIGFVPSANENLTLRLAGGVYYQAPFYKELRDTTTTDGATVVCLNQDIRSQRSYQLVLGGEYKFRVAERPFKFTSELYYKKQSNLNPYNVDNLKVVYYGRNEARGYVAGLDLKVYGEFVPGTDSWVSFSLMKAQMTLHGKHIPQPTDQRWNVNMFFSDYFPGTDRWKMTLKMAFAGGLPFGPPHTGLETNVFRAPTYRRVDLGMSYRLLNSHLCLWNHSLSYDSKFLLNHLLSWHLLNSNWLYRSCRCGYWSYRLNCRSRLCFWSRLNLWLILILCLCFRCI